MEPCTEPGPWSIAEAQRKGLRAGSSVEALESMGVEAGQDQWVGRKDSTWSLLHKTSSISKRNKKRRSKRKGKISPVHGAEDFM